MLYVNAVQILSSFHYQPLPATERAFKAFLTHLV